MMITVGMLCGLVLAGLHFGGLWWTLRRCARSPQALQWLLLSSGVRIVLVALGLVWVLQQLGVWGLGGALLGFVLGRGLCLRYLPRRETHAPQP